MSDWTRTSVTAFQNSPLRPPQIDCIALSVHIDDEPEDMAMRRSSGSLKGKGLERKDSMMSTESFMRDLTEAMQEDWRTDETETDGVEGRVAPNVSVEFEGKGFSPLMSARARRLSTEFREERRAREKEEETVDKEQTEHAIGAFREAVSASFQQVCPRILQRSLCFSRPLSFSLCLAFEPF